MTGRIVPGETLAGYRIEEVIGRGMPAGDAFGLDRVVSPARGDPGRFDSPMVGRECERRRLHDAFEQAVDRR